MTAKVWRSLFCLPYAIPPYIAAIAWIVLANPSNGLLNSALGYKIFNIYSLGGLVWVMGSFFYTFVLLSVLTALDRVDPSLEEAARLSGASPLKVFTSITLPVISPAFFSGMLLVFLAASACFGVPALIGTPARIFMLVTKIYTYQKMGSISGIYMAGSLSIILLVLSFLILWFNRRFEKRAFEVVSGKSNRAQAMDWGNKQWAIQFLLITLFSVLFLLPVSGIFVAATSKIQGIFSLDNFTFNNFVKIFFHTDETPRAIKNSFILAASVATACCALGVFLSYIVKKTRIKGRQIIPVIATLPFASPGTVIALALILAANIQFFNLSFSLYNTIYLIGLAYFAKYLNFSLRTCGDGLGQINNSLAEASRVSGASWGQTMKKIWIPLLLPSIVASWFLVFMPAFSELTMTILLSGPGIETMGTLLFQLQEYGDASGGGAAVLALFVIVMVTVINYLVKFLSKGRYGL